MPANDTNECLICKQPLEYLEREEEMECLLCRKKEGSRTRCVNGHYVCDECHTQGFSQLFTVCLAHDSANPFTIMNDLMNLECCHMHGPEHHVFVNCALLTAYKNAGGDIDLEEALKEGFSRGRKLPGGTCGYWGACGAAISSGQFVSIVTKSTPLANEAWGLSNLMTSKSLQYLGELGGPRCCKRNSYLSIKAAIEFSKEHLGVEMEGTEDLTCTHFTENKQCIGKRCPFNPVNTGK